MVLMCIALKTAFHWHTKWLTNDNHQIQAEFILERKRFFIFIIFFNRIVKCAFPFFEVMSV